MWGTTGRRRKRLRIAFVGGFGFKPKGTIQSRAHPLAAELVAQGHEVTIFVPPYDNPNESGREWTLEGVRIKGLKVGATPLGYPALLLRLVRAVENYRPDVVHIFKPKGFAGAAGIYLRLKGMRIALDCDDWEGRGGFNDTNTYPWMLKEYIDRQERWMMRTTRVVTVASRWLEERVCKVRGNSAGVFYLPNCGVSAANAQIQDDVRRQSQVEIKKELGLPPGPIIFYSGHFDSAEDPMFFCRCAAAVAERHHATIVFVGDGPELGSVKQFFAERQKSASFFPRLPYDQFIRVVWASDVTAFPFPDDSVHRAKCSARIIDYMAMGKPVITTAIGQNTEYIVDQESGILAPPGDEKVFAAKLEELVRNREIRVRLGEAARNRIREKFRWGGKPSHVCLSAYQELAKV